MSCVELKRNETENGCWMIRIKKRSKDEEKKTKADFQGRFYASSKHVKPFNLQFDNQ